MHWSGFFLLRCHGKVNAGSGRSFLALWPPGAWSSRFPERSLAPIQFISRAKSRSRDRFVLCPLLGGQGSALCRQPGLCSRNRGRQYSKKKAQRIDERVDWSASVNGFCRGWRPAEAAATARQQNPPPPPYTTSAPIGLDGSPVASPAFSSADRCPQARKKFSERKTSAPLCVPQHAPGFFPVAGELIVFSLPVEGDFSRREPAHH